MDEVLEHLEDPARVLAEVSRVLRPGGTLILSMPFLFPVHCAPHDYQRWTSVKLERELAAQGLADPEITAMGGVLAVVHDLLAGTAKKMGFKPLRSLLRLALRCSAPLLSLLESAIYDSRKNVTTGYFVVARKKRDTLPG